MSEAMSIFMNSYLKKKMRRPEMGEGFSPDQAFGANMVHGSESLNPSAIRDTTNAQFGSMKSPLQQGQAVNIPGTGSVQNMPILGGNQNTPFASMMNKNTTDMAGTVTPNVVAPWLTEKLKGLLAEKPSEVFADSISQTPTDPMTLFEPAKYDVADGMGGYQKVGENFAKDATDLSPYVSPSEGSSILDGLSPDSVGAGVATAAAPKMMETLTGSKIAGDATGAAVNVGMAAAQGGLNPISDLAAVYSLYKLMRGLF